MVGLRALILLSLSSSVACGVRSSGGADDPTVANASLHEERRWAMGTELRLVLVGAGERAPAITDRCFDVVAAIEESLSTWIDDSALSRFNGAEQETVRISPYLADYLARCRRDAERTGGAFDPSVGTWRGRGSGEERPVIGMQRLVLLERGGEHVAVRPHRAYAIDSGGNGKGAAVDAVIEVLRDEGIEAALVDFGGSSWFGLGRPPDGDAWRVAYVPPGEEAPREVVLHDRALSVSSSWQEDRALDGSVVRRAHIVDPRTGIPVTRMRMAVVTSPSALDAEVLSTALVVEGRTGLALLARYDDARGEVFESGEVVSDDVDGP